MGFLDPKERVIDMVLTDEGKNLLMRGELRFVFWMPYDDEVDYNPPATPRAGQTLEERMTELTESPLVREACSGYRGLNLREEDTTNVNRPMFTAPPGVARAYPLPRMSLSTGSIDLSIQQNKLSRVYYQQPKAGIPITQKVGPIDDGFQRHAATESVLEAKYPDGAFPADHVPEGFLLTVYHSSTLKIDELGQVTGGFEEILHNRDSSGDVAYRNDLKLDNQTP